MDRPDDPTVQQPATPGAAPSGAGGLFDLGMRTVATGGAGGSGFQEQPGDFIGPYRLLQKIGTGGFGDVWRAEQLKPIHREVALKVIKAGMDSAEIIARFEAERQALALMDHPNIAAVLDAGTTQNGRPYFAMELVKGSAITTYCDERKLSVRQRLELFIPVCLAVQHAHQKAILHRDLKPSNILVAEVDGKPVPKVIDFGIAKALGTSPEAALQGSMLRTQEGMVIGTPQYMSPEQAGSVPDVDTRSDIYTLGVILYELLTGQTPLTGDQLRKAAFDEVLRLVREGDAKRPSSRFIPATELAVNAATGRGSDVRALAQALRGDLDWIMLKALEKDRTRRYETANALALDLQRHLRDEPVSAGPPGAGYRVRKLVRRNRLAFGAASVVFVALVVGIAGSTWQWRVAVREREQKRLQFERAELEKQHAEDARDAAEDLISASIHGLREKLLAVGRVDMMEDMVAAADGYFQRLPHELATSESERHRASLAMNRALIATALGRDDEQEKFATEARDLTDRLARSQPGRGDLEKEATYAMLNLCYLHYDRADYDTSLSLADQVVARCEDWLRREPGTPWALHHEVLAHDLAAQVLVRRLGNVVDGFARVQKATAAARRLREAAGETAETCEAEGLIHYSDGKIAQRLKQMDRASKSYGAAATSFARALELGGVSALRQELHAGSMHHAGATMRDLGREKKDPVVQKRGEDMIRVAFEMRSRLVTLEPGRAEWWRDLAWSHDTLAEISREAGDAAEVLHQRQECVRCRDEAIKRQTDRALLYEERAGARSKLADALARQQPPATQEAAEVVLATLEDWQRCMKLSRQQLVNHRPKPDIELLGRLVPANRQAGTGWLARAKDIIQPFATETDGRIGARDGLVALLGVQRDNFTALGQTAEADEVRAALEKLTGGRKSPP